MLLCLQNERYANEGVIRLVNSCDVKKLVKRFESW